MRTRGSGSACLLLITYTFLWIYSSRRTFKSGSDLKLLMVLLSMSFFVSVFSFLSGFLLK